VLGDQSVQRRLLRLVDLQRVVLGPAASLRPDERVLFREVLNRHAGDRTSDDYSPSSDRADIGHLEVGTTPLEALTLPL